MEYKESGLQYPDQFFECDAVDGDGGDYEMYVDDENTINGSIPFQCSATRVVQYDKLTARLMVAMDLLRNAYSKGSYMSRAPYETNKQLLLVDGNTVVLTENNLMVNDNDESDIKFSIAAYGYEVVPVVIIRVVVQDSNLMEFDFIDRETMRLIEEGSFALPIAIRSDEECEIVANSLSNFSSVVLNVGDSLACISLPKVDPDDMYIPLVNLWEDTDKWFMRKGVMNGNRVVIPYVGCIP